MKNVTKRFKINKCYEFDECKKEKMFVSDNFFFFTIKQLYLKKIIVPPHKRKETNFFHISSLSVNECTITQNKNL